MGQNLPAVIKQNVQQIEQHLEESMSQLSVLLGSQVKAAQMATVVMDLVTNDTKLRLCTPGSIIRAVMEASQLGLQLTKTLGHGYLVPYKNGALTEKEEHDVYEATFQWGYQGYMDKSKESDPNIATIFSRLVWPGEEFQVIEGTEHKLTHYPKPQGGTIQVGQAGSLSGFEGVYSIVKFKDGTEADFEWLPLHEVEKIRRAAKATADDAPWKKWPDAMVKKTAIRRLCRRLKLHPDIKAAMTLDEYRELGIENGSTPAPLPAMPRRKNVPVIDTTATALPAGAPPAPPDYSKDPHPACPKCGGPTRLVMPRSGDKWGPGWGCAAKPKNCKDKGVKGAWVDAAEWHAQLQEKPEEEPAPPAAATSPEQRQDPRCTVDGYRKAIGEYMKRDAKITIDTLKANIENFKSLDESMPSETGRLMVCEAIEEALKAAGK